MQNSMDITSIFIFNNLYKIIVQNSKKKSQMPRLLIIIMFLLIVCSISADVEQVEMGRFEITVPSAFYQLNNLHNTDKITAMLTWNIDQYLSLLLSQGYKLLQSATSTTGSLSFEYTVKSKGDYYMKVTNQQSEAVWYSLIIKINDVVIVNDDRSVAALFNMRQSYKMFNVQQKCKRVKLVSNDSNNSSKVIWVSAKNPDKFNRQYNNEREQASVSSPSAPQMQISFDKPGDWLFIVQNLQNPELVRTMQKILYRIEFIVKCVVCVSDHPAEQCQENYIRKKKEISGNNESKKSNVSVVIIVVGVIAITSIAGFFVLKKFKERKANATLTMNEQNCYADTSNNENNQNYEVHRRQEEPTKQIIKQNNPGQQVSSTNNMETQTKLQKQTKIKIQKQKQQLNSQQAIKNFNENDKKLDDFEALQQQVINQDKIKSLLNKFQQKQ